MHLAFTWVVATATLSALVSAADQTVLFDLTESQIHHHHDGPSIEEWDYATKKASKFLSSFSLKDKINIVTGNTFKGVCVGNLAPNPAANFSGLCMSDGPQAVNRADLISIFPSGVTTAATWDRNLMYKRAHFMAKEFRSKGINVHLGPVSGPLGRHALGGRNWEAYSPDPYLTGIAMGLAVRGFQDLGVQTSSKHFIGNEQETQRSKQDGPNGTDAISSNIDDKTLHELYLWPFVDAIRAGTTSIMCSYNRINSTYACQNKKLLTSILRDELDFKGYVVSDWWATHATQETANSGLDLEMPGWENRVGKGDPWYGESLEKAIKCGNVSQDRLDEMAKRVMTPYFLLHQDSVEYPTVDETIGWVAAVTKYGWSSPVEALLPPIKEARDVRGDHAKFIREMGAAATVLLKNTNDTLPLTDRLGTIGIFGNDAADPADGLYRDGPVEMGTLDIGGGSGSGRHFNVVSPLIAIRQKAAELGARVQYVLNNDLLMGGDTSMIFPKPDVCLIFTKAWAGEGSDRETLKLDWHGNEVITSVASWCNNTVVIMHAGGIVSMPWADNANVTAILAAHYPGEQSGHSIVDVLWGHVNPSGKLPFTIPRNPEDYQPPIVRAPQGDGDWVSNFDEGPLIDYRYFDKEKIMPLYEFGFGLSYTSFELGLESMRLQIALSVESCIGEFPNKSLGKVPGGWEDLWSTILTIEIPVRNTGKRDGHAVVQLYMAFPKHEKEQPDRVLRGFDKVHLKPGESADTKFTLRRRDLSVWDVVKQEWRIPKGAFSFWASFSSNITTSAIEIEIL